MYCAFVTPKSEKKKFYFEMQIKNINQIRD